MTWLVWLIPVLIFYAAEGIACQTDSQRVRRILIGIEYFCAAAIWPICIFCGLEIIWVSLAFLLFLLPRLLFGRRT